MSGQNRKIFGLLAVVPAMIALVVSYLWPTVWTIKASLTGYTPVTGVPAGHDVGSDYGHAVGTFAKDVGFSWTSALVPLVVALGLGVLVGWLAAGASTGVRRVVRGLLAVCAVTVAPVALYTSWAHDGRLSGGGALGGRWPVWATAIPLGVALVATVYLAVFRSRDESGAAAGAPAPTGGGTGTPVPGSTLRGGAALPGAAAQPDGSGISDIDPQARRSALLVGLIVVCAGLAVSLQVFTAPLFGRRASAGPPLAHVMNEFFLTMRGGRGAALDTLLLLVLGALGLAAAAVVVFGGLRVEYTARDSGRRAGPGGPLAIVLVALVLLLLGYAAWPWLRELGAGEISMGKPAGFPASVGSVLVNTWLPPLVAAVVGVGLAVLAGFGIGALRPLGRRSELLLLPFAPWLFVGLGPLVPHGWVSLVNDHELNTGLLALIPPSWLSIPTLFLTTLFFRGQHARRQEGRPAGPARLDVLRAAPLVAAAFLLVWVGYAQNTSWQWVAATPVRPTAVNVVLRGAQEYAGAPRGTANGIGLASPPPVLLLLLAGLVALQLFVLDRLALRSGALPPDVPAPTGAGAPAQFAGPPAGYPASAGPAGGQPPYPPAGFPQQHPAQQYPAQQYPAQQHPAQQYPAQQHPAGQQYPAQQYPAGQQPPAGQRHPAQQYPAQQNPGTPSGAPQQATPPQQWAAPAPQQWTPPSASPAPPQQWMPASPPQQPWSPSQPPANPGQQWTAQGATPPAWSPQSAPPDPTQAAPSQQRRPQGAAEPPTSGEAPQPAPETWPQLPPAQRQAPPAEQ